MEVNVVTISGRWKLNVPNKNGQVFTEKCFSNYINTEEIPGTLQPLATDNPLRPSNIVCYTKLSLVKDSIESYIEYNTTIVNGHLNKVLQWILSQGITVFAVPLGTGQVHDDEITDYVLLSVNLSINSDFE